MLLLKAFIPSVMLTSAEGALALKVVLMGEEVTAKLKDMSLFGYSIQLVCLLASWNTSKSDTKISSHSARDKKIVSQLSPDTLIGNLGIYRECCHALASINDEKQLDMDEKKVSCRAFRGE